MGEPAFKLPENTNIESGKNNQGDPGSKKMTREEIKGELAILRSKQTDSRYWTKQDADRLLELQAASEEKPTPQEMAEYTRLSLEINKIDDGSGRGLTESEHKEFVELQEKIDTYNAAQKKKTKSRF